MLMLHILYSLLFPNTHGQLRLPWETCGVQHTFNVWQKAAAQASMAVYAVFHAVCCCCSLGSCCCGCLAIVWPVPPCNAAIHFLSTEDILQQSPKGVRQVLPGVWWTRNTRSQQLLKCSFLTFAVASSPETMKLRRITSPPYETTHEFTNPGYQTSRITQRTLIVW